MASYSSSSVPLSGSSSYASKGPQVADSSYFYFLEGDVNKADMSNCKYSLVEMAAARQLQLDKSLRSKQYAAKIFQGMFPEQYTLTVDREIPNMKLLAGLVSNSTERIDVVVYAEERVVAMAIEVQSSPMSHTVYKSVLGTANIIRLARIHDEKTDQFISFAVPSCNSNGCIVKILLKWHEFRFHVTLTVYKDPVAGLREIENIAKKQRVKLPADADVGRPSLIRLSSRDIEQIVENGTQIHSHRHITMRFGEGRGRICKILYDTKEQYSFRYYQSVTAKGSLQWGVRVTEDSFKPSLDIIVYTYCAEMYDPLSREEAGRCLKNLLYSVKETLDDLHSLRLSHNDVRLPNICFNEDFHAVLIDIDTCWIIGQLHPYFRNSKSCMYSEIEGETILRTGDKTDFRQLGWLAAFILDPTANEHDRTFEDLPDNVKRCEFLRELILKGNWNAEEFKKFDFCGTSHTLQDIIQKRPLPKQ